MKMIKQTQNGIDRMKTIVLASKNPVKIQATQNAFNRMFHDENFRIQAVDVPSGVSEQPASNRETLRGANNRVKNAFKMVREADYWVGIEGGVAKVDGQLSSFAWIVIRSAIFTSQSRTGTFFLPPVIARLIDEGKELGVADDIVFGQTNSKQKNGAIGLLTEGVIDRTGLYEHGIILALAPFKHLQLYGGV